MSSTRNPAKVNGLDLQALAAMVETIQADPSRATAKFQVTTRWQGQARSETEVSSYVLGGEEIPRVHRIRIDEPFELLGGDSAPNPQEVLMAALNACMMLGYVAGCALEGIDLRGLEIETEGRLDLRGFLGLADVPPGYETIRYTVRMDCEADESTLRAIHENVQRTSPNFYHLSRPIRLEGRLERA